METLVIGRELGHFRVEAKLGEGGMGELYRATDTRLGRSVAIKVLRPDAVSSESRRKRFAQESRAASALNHPNIVTVYDVGRADGVDFIAMELVEGESLDALIPPSGMEVEQALEVARQVVDALSAAHGAGIVHRDIKPQNIMVDASGRVKILDFGLAKLLDTASSDESAPIGDSESPTRSAHVETQEGAVVGTAAYMSPEQAEGRKVDARTDLFSLGVVLYEMLTGRRPFHGDSFLSIRAAVLKQEATPLREIRSDVPKAVADVVGRCLTKDREKRCGTEELGDVLKLVAARPRWLVPAAVGVALVVSALGWTLYQQQRVDRVRTEVLPEIERLIEAEDHFAAFRLAEEASVVLSDDPGLNRLLESVGLGVCRSEQGRDRPSDRSQRGRLSRWRRFTPTSYGEDFCASIGHRDKSPPRFGTRAKRLASTPSVS